MAARIDHLETSGTFSLDGETHQVDNNVWIVGDDSEVIVIDPAHDVEAVVSAVGGRRVAAILLTHGHDDHIRQVQEVKSKIGGQIHLNPEDRMLWDQVFEGVEPDAEIQEGDTFSVAGIQLKALHTPGHSPGSTCFFAEELEGKPVLFSGDTLFQGGPGATGRSFSSFDTIIESIRTKLFELPGDTVVNTGHGPSTRIGEESPKLQEWIERGQ
ncbi:MBL fold metallo-hydrolase [Nesterenkonia sp. MY13]|uniref:MBL fold metallo-hydrolase n=1 Tax=Nesterenkonia sedimenti TaxID=1463632 RepID=A0A7X8YDC3_9MICC|nr:MBL fold metallo-hydrolase [Nesterenkonia sedimenti]NLS08992.1 MBL fold metallo-hydrolase [Nesterenkonia sedimenti]